jgi:hypothetical protein
VNGAFDTAGEYGREHRATYTGETHEARHPRRHKNKVHRLFTRALLWSSRTSQHPAGGLLLSGRCHISEFAQLCAIALYALQRTHVDTQST